MYIITLKICLCRMDNVLVYVVCTALQLRYTGLVSSSVIQRHFASQTARSWFEIEQASQKIVQACRGERPGLSAADLSELDKALWKIVQNERKKAKLTSKRELIKFIFNAGDIVVHTLEGSSKQVLSSELCVPS